MNTEEKYRAIYDGHPVLHFCERFSGASSIWNYDRHSHPYHELMFFLEGNASIHLEEMRFSASLYDTVIYPAHHAHREQASPNLKREVICLWIELPELVLEEPMRIQDSDGRIGSLFLRIHKESREIKATPFLMEYYIKALLTMILRLADEARSPSPLSKSLQYIQTHYADPISIETLTKLEHISRSYLSRQFKRVTGMTVVQYINTLRIETAKRLLIATGDSVANIGYRVGFGSSKYFLNVFRELCGTTPGAFRKTNRTVPDSEEI